MVTAFRLLVALYVKKRLLVASRGSEKGSAFCPLVLVLVWECQVEVFDDSIYLGGFGIVRR